ncbi:HYR domain-containing protein [Winogradskyella sp.]|uniref:HYR domain-containing protein n=1 Tax=Winogradskyella sp. TaxID=1883156 RepID=UPI003BA9C4BA
MTKLPLTSANLCAKTYRVQYSINIKWLWIGLLIFAFTKTSAQTTYYLDNVVFNDGSIATGSFDYNPLGGAVQYTNINIFVSNSSIYGTATFTTVRPFSVDPTNAQFFTASSGISTNAPVLSLNFNPGLNTTNNANLTGFTGICTTGDCNFIINPITPITSGTVRANTPPNAVCSNFTVSLDAAGNASINASDIDGGSTDDIAGFILSIDKSSFTCSDLGSNTVTLTVTDANGATDSCQATVTVEDNIAPVFEGFSSDVVIDAGMCGANVTASVTFSDNCSSFTLTNDYTGTSDASGFYPVGTTVVIWTATDTSGNSVNRAQFINVEDVEPASVTCPSDVIVNNDTGLCSAMVSVPAPTVVDNCPVTLSNSFNGTADASGVYPIGTTVVNWSVLETSGDLTFCSQSITVNDIEAPTITCSSDIFITNDVGLCSASVTIPPPTVTDNCPNVTITNDFNNSSDASGTYPIGTTTVTWTVTDPGGNTDTCTQTIAVNDTEGPSVSCSDTSFDCAQVVNYTIPATTDNCGLPEVPLSIPNTTILGTFGNSTYFIDSRNLSASFAFAVGEGSDYDLVTINSPEENEYLRQQLVNLGLNAFLIGYNDIDNEGSFVWQSGQPATYENWLNGNPDSATGDEDYVFMFSDGMWVDGGGNGVIRLIYEVHDYSTGAILASGLTPGSLFAETTVNTFFSKDIYGNITTCTETITINDTQAPDITNCDDIMVNIDPGTCVATVAAPTATDNCVVASFVNNLNNNPGNANTYPVGTTVLTWTAMDFAGNMSSCMQTITVTENDIPEITGCPADSNLLNCPQVYDYTIPTTTDCSFPAVPISIPDFAFLGRLGNSTYFVSNTPMTPPQAYAMAQTNGYDLVTINSQTENAFLSQLAPTGSILLGYNDIDTEGTFTWQSRQPNFYENWDTGQPSGSAADVDYVQSLNGNWSDIGPTTNISVVLEFHDYTGGQPIQVSGLPPGALFTSTTTNTFFSKDSSGNSNTCSFTVNIQEDTTPPSVFCPNDVTVNCPQIVSYGNTASSDNCSFPTVPTTVPNFTLLGTFRNSTYFVSNNTLTAPQAFALASGNGYDLVTVNSADENTFLVDAMRTIDISNIFLGYNDIQTEGDFVWQSGQPNFYENWTPNNPDSSFGNEDYVELSSDGRWYDRETLTLSYVVLEFHDYSNGKTTQVTGFPSGSLFTQTTVNTFYAKDAGGNINTCAVTVTVEDANPPMMTCPADISVNADANACSASVTVPIPNMLADDCGATLIPSTSKVLYNFDLNGDLIDTPATLNNISTTLEDVILRVAFKGDHNGSSESFVLTGPDMVTLLDVNDQDPGCSIKEYTITVPTATWNTWESTYGSSLTFTLLADQDVDDNQCGQASENFFQIEAVNQGNVYPPTNDFNNTTDASGTYPVGTTTITWTITDLAGNTGTCTQSITVNETEAPVMSCPSAIAVNTDSGLCSATVTFDKPTVTDNCTEFTNSLQNVLNNFNQKNLQLTSLIPNAYNFLMDGSGDVNSDRIEDGGIDMYDDGNFIGTDLNAGPINYSDNTVITSTAFGANGTFFTRKVDNMWLLGADLDNVNSFDITGNLGADSSGAADGFTASITVGNTTYNIFVKRVREDLSGADSDPSVNHLIIIPENANATQNFSADTDDDQHQVTGLSGTTRLYYLLFASENSGLVDNTAMEAIATSFVTNMFTISGTIEQTEGLASGSTFPVGTTTNTFVATDASGNTDTCSFTVTVTDPSGNCNVLVSPKVYLQGSTLNSTVTSDGLMRDDLRTGNHIPLNTPYTDNTSINGSVLNVTGADAIVDWVWVELRDANANTVIVEGKSALLQRDGDVVALDGLSALMFGQLAGSYYVVIKHRNHLGIMSSATIALSSTTTLVDFTNGSTVTFGNNAQTTLGLSNGTFAMWVGDSNGDTVVQYVGGIQDTPGILAEVLNDNGNFLNLPTFVATGYSNRDVNMDGNIQYAGGNSELPFILQNVLDDPRNFLNLSTWPINAQLPNNNDRAMQLRNQFESSKY